MKKEAIPRGFPVGRARLTRHLSGIFRGDSGIRRLPPMISPFGPAPGYKPGSTLEGDRRTLMSRMKGSVSELLASRGIEAASPQTEPISEVTGMRSKGTLSEFMAAKKDPTSIRSNFPPMLDQTTFPADVQQNLTNNGGNIR